MPRSLRARSVAAALLATLVALVVVGAGVDVLVGRHLHRALDRSLHARAVEVAQLSATAPALLLSPGALDAPSGGTQAFTQVVDRHGRIVARSLSLGGRSLAVDAAVRRVIQGGEGRYGSVRLGDERLRIYLAPLAAAGGAAAGGAVIVAASTRDLRETLASVHVFVLSTAVAAALASTLALALLMGRALAPLTRLTRAATEIEQTGDSRLRLPEPQSKDEIGRLALTLNQMLAALDRARETERRFLADASHELRTPLTALVGNVDYVARHGASDELIAELQLDAHRLARLADDLLMLSREEAARLPVEVVRLDELADEVEGVTVIAPVPVGVRGDRAALARALANLVENAQRHGSGRVMVEVTADSESALLSVVDEGPGLPPDQADLAFERFWRGLSDAEGSGLGLAIVRAIAERHGGRAFARGARFTIELPAVRDVSESGTRTGKEQQKGSP